MEDVDLLECKDCIDDARENYYNLGHYFARKNGKMDEFYRMKWKGKVLFVGIFL